MAQFKKGQTVYQACSNFSQDAKCNTTMAVVERIVDSCGTKVMTFAERAVHNDSVFGKSVRNWQGRGFHNIHATPAEAFAALHVYAAQAVAQRAARPDVYVSTGVYRLIPDVLSDADGELFVKFRAGQIEAFPVTV